MWYGFLGNIVNNIQKGLSGAIATLTTSPQTATTLNQGEAPRQEKQNVIESKIKRTPDNVDPKIANPDQLSSDLFGVDPEIASAFLNSDQQSTTLLSKLITDPNDYENFSQTDKILVTRIVIEDLKDINEKHGNTLTKTIKSIITRISNPEYDSFIDKYDASVISDYYVKLHEATEKQILVEAKKPPSFQCQRGGAPGHGRAGGGGGRGRRSEVTLAPLPALFPYSPRSENHNPAQLQKSKKMQDGMREHIASKQERESIHPAGLIPITNSPKQNQSQNLTGQGARDAVLIRGGIRPTRYQSGDEKKEKEQNLENIGKKLARLEFDLFQNNISKGNLYTAKYRPESGNHNSRRMKGYRGEGSNIQKDIETLNERLLEIYTKEERAKVDAARINELHKLKSTPSVRPSAPLVVNRILSPLSTRHY